MANIIGILGGTFDPIHLGHLRLSLELAEALTISRIHLIPSYQPVHRHAPIASAAIRLAMVEEAVRDQSLFVADAREINREGKSYTVDTLNEMRAEFPDAHLCLFMGYDAFLEFNTWHRYQEILNLAHIAIANRPNFAQPENGPIFDLIQARKQENPQYIQQKQAGGLFFIETTLLDISASNIRKQIAMGANPRYLLPDNVFHYIQQNGIYKK